MRLSYIVDELAKNIVKVARDPRGDSRVHPQTTLVMFWQNSLWIRTQTYENLHQFVFVFTITNSQIVRSPLLTQRKNYKLMHLPICSLQELANKRARISDKPLQNQQGLEISSHWKGHVIEWPCYEKLWRNLRDCLVSSRGFVHI